MKKHELLVPVGNMECLHQAIANGADAVYGACQCFGARKFAKNFTNEEIVDAIKLCHLYGVKFYVTMNTLVKDSEVSSFLEQVEFLYKNGVDAIIMQDFGMISYVLRRYPNLEVHASTQLNNSSYDIVKLLYEMGVKRVVLSREMSLEEIEKIDVPIEKEVFIHGALCISYSGCCLMSSMIGGRSGNRGECAGSCRLPYQLYEGDTLLSDSKYLLSTKELNTSYHFRKLLDSNIYSFKIEGRMKSPEYVGFITRMYRHLIDSNANDFDLDVENDKLKTIFNREFTKGHLFQSSVSELMNTSSANHVGLVIGKVISCDNKRIGIRLEQTLHQGDGIRFLESGKGLIINYLYDAKGLLVSEVYKGNVCYIDNKIGLTGFETVSKTSDSLLMEELRKLPHRRVPVSYSVTAREGEPFTVSISDRVHTVSEEGSIVQKSITSPVSADRIRTQLEKLGNTPFISEAFEIDKDEDIFISLRDINEIRRTLVDKLSCARMAVGYSPVIREVVFDYLNLSCDTEKSCSVFNEKQLLACLKLGFSRVYVNNYSLFLKYQSNSSVYYSIPRCLFSMQREIPSRTLVKDLFSFSNRDSFIGDYTLNVCNIYTAYYLYQLGLSKITLSVELSSSEVNNFVDLFYHTFGCFPNVEVVRYGAVEVMVIKDNILDLKENVFSYYLKDLHQRLFPVYFNGVQTIILNYNTQPKLDFHSLCKDVSVRYQFYQENENEIFEIVKNN